MRGYKLNKIKSVILLVGLLVSTGASAEDVAQCSNPSGKGYFPNLGLVKKADSGWSDEKITGGITTLSKISKGEYDILFVDTTKRIVSTTQDGGKVYMLYLGEREASFLVVYRQTAEIYNFLVDNEGKAEYTNVITRAGDGVMITKASVMRGECKFVNLDLLR